MKMYGVSQEIYNAKSLRRLLSIMDTMSTKQDPLIWSSGASYPSLGNGKEREELSRLKCGLCIRETGPLKAERWGN